MESQQMLVKGRTMGTRYSRFQSERSTESSPRVSSISTLDSKPSLCDFVDLEELQLRELPTHAIRSVRPSNLASLLADTLRLASPGTRESRGPRQPYDISSLP